MPEPRTLVEALETLGPYPADHPQTLLELLDADPESLNHPLAWWLRGQAVEVRRSSEAHYIRSPKDALKLLKNGYVLHPWSGKWNAYALSENRQVIRVPHARGGTTPLRKVTPIIPKAADLPTLPRGASRDGRSTKSPAWLVIYGGTPDVMTKPGVARGLASLQARSPVADVLFFDGDKRSGRPPTLWSVKAGHGIQVNGDPDGLEVSFPDPQALSEARSSA